MKTQTQHTPTPWRQINGAIFDTIPWNKDQTRHTVPALFIPSPQQQSAEQNIANAAFIVRVVNSHEALMEVAKKAKDEIEYLKGNGALINELHKAIAQAEGK